MKNKNLHLLNYLIILLLYCIPTHVTAQDFILGLKYGYGNSTFTRQSDNLKTPTYKTHKAMLIAEFSPYYSRLFIITGAAYEMNDLSQNITIPFTLRVVFGKTIRPFIEGGAYYSYVLNDESDDFTLKNDLGANVMAGLLINLGKNWRLELGYNYRFGFTKALEEEILLPLNQVMLEEYRRKSGSVDLGVKYRF